MDSQDSSHSQFLLLSTFFFIISSNFTMMERRSPCFTLFIGTLSILGVMIFSPHVVYGQEDIRSPSILPDSPFWGIKLAIENIQERFTFQEERKAELFLKHSDERDIEAIALERQGKMIPLERLKAIQAEKLMRAEQIILKLERAQNIIDEREEARQERSELAQATTEEERIAIQMQQRAQDLAERSNLIEPRTDMGILERNSERVSDKPVTILPVDDIREFDDQKTVLTKLRDRLQNSFAKSEVTEIRAKFGELRAENDPVKKELLAKQLDSQVNNPLVSVTCLGRVNTLSLSIASDPVRELQNQCPILKPFDREIVRDMMNGVS